MKTTDAGYINKNNQKNLGYMIEEIEKIFVEKYISKRIQDRLIFELGGKKRKQAIGRFCHNAEDIIKTDRIVSSGTKIFMDEILTLAKKYNASGECYIMAFNEHFDKTSTTLNNALNLVLGNGMAAIIICDDLVIIETEQCLGIQMRYILH